MKYDVDFIELVCRSLVGVCNKRINTRDGICDNVNDYLNDLTYDHGKIYDAKIWMRNTWKQWPGYSGNPNFPVSVSTMVEPNEQYMEVDNCWDTNTEYGRARWDLLAFLLERASKMKVK